MSACALLLYFFLLLSVRDPIDVVTPTVLESEILQAQARDIEMFDVRRRLAPISSSRLPASVGRGGPLCLRPVHVRCQSSVPRVEAYVFSEPICDSNQLRAPCLRFASPACAVVIVKRGLKKNTSSL